VARSVSKESLYIIGNGFDIYHGLRSRYSDFKNYLSGSDPTVHDLVDEFIPLNGNWSDLEQALADIDVDHVVDYASQFFVPYGAEDWSDHDHQAYQGEVDKIVTGLSEGLKTRFTDWIVRLDIPSGAEVGVKILDLDKAAKYLTFNYTSILSRIYEVPRANVLFIHGDAGSQNQDIVLGHAWNPTGIPSLNDVTEPESLDPRVMEGNELINDYFGRTFKNTSSIIDANKSFFSSLSEISNIYILGHSLSDVDIAYFKAIIQNIDTDKVHWRISHNGDNELAKHRNTMNALGIDTSKLSFCTREIFDTSAQKPIQPRRRKSESKAKLFLRAAITQKMLNLASAVATNRHESCGESEPQHSPRLADCAGCSKWHPSKAAGSGTTEAYPCGTSQGGTRLRTTRGVIFSILLMRIIPLLAVYLRPYFMHHSLIERKP
jgi:hypothetical protein